MRAYLSWMIQKVRPVITSVANSAITTTNKTLSGIKSATVALYQVIRRKKLTDRIPFLKGLFRVLDPATIIKLITSEKSSYVLRHTVYDNVIYGIGATLLYKIIIQPGIKCLPFTDNPVSETIIDTAAQLFFIRMSIKLMVNNTLYSASLSKAVYDEHPQSKHLPPCPCGSTTKIFSSLASSLYHTGKMTTVFCAETAIDSMIPHGKKLLLPVRALVYGQSFLDSKLNNAGMCTTHKNEILNKNYEYAFGCGVSFLIFLSACEQIIYLSTGVQHPSISAAIFNIGMQYYTANMNLLDEPLPNNKVSTDYFKPLREVTRLTTKIITNEIVQLTQNKNNNYDWEKLQKQIIEFPPTQLALKILIDDNFKSLHKFITQPATQVYLEINGTSISDAIKYIIAIQQSNMTKKAIYWGTYLVPTYFVSNSTKSILTIMIDENMQTFLEATNQFITKYNPRNLRPFTIQLLTDKPLSENIQESYVSRSTEPEKLNATPTQAHNPRVFNVVEDYSGNLPASATKTTQNEPIRIIQN